MAAKNHNAMELVVELIKLGATGVIAGVFSSLLANRDHRYKKWWELRVSIYTDLINALSDISYYYERHYNATIENRDLRNDFREKVEIFLEESFPRIRRAADAGAFIFSDKVNKALKKYIESSLIDFDSYEEFLDNNLYETKKCLEAVVKASKQDLKVNRWWL